MTLTKFGEGFFKFIFSLLNKKDTPEMPKIRRIFGRNFDFFTGVVLNSV